MHRTRDEEYAALLMTLSFFASKSLAEGFRQESGGGSLSKMAATIARLLPDAVAEYAHLGRSIHTAIAESEAPAPVRRPDKVGRNDPCPCGSGRKYKKCCGLSQ